MSMYQCYLFAFAASAFTQPASSVTFSPPVAMPEFCPWETCRYGGSTAADSFHSFGALSHSVLGKANGTVVKTADGGATWSVVEPRQSSLGPGLPRAVDKGRRLVTLGNAALQAPGAKFANGTEIATWAPNGSHTTTLERVSWAMPRDDICLLSGYSGSVVTLGEGTLLKTMVIKTNCTAVPKPGWGTFGNSDIYMFASRDGGASWAFRSVVARANETGGSGEGANENDVVVRSDGSLLVVFRVDGGDGYPLHAHRPFMKTVSHDNGLTWSMPVTLPSHVLSARPQMLMVAPEGPLPAHGGAPAPYAVGFR